MCGSLLVLHFCRHSIVGCMVFLRIFILVQSFYGLTFNKLQQKCSQLFLVQKNVLYNILKVLQNLMGGKHEKFAKMVVIKWKNFFVKLKKISLVKQLYQVKAHSLMSRMIPKSKL